MQQAKSKAMGSISINIVHRENNQKEKKFIVNGKRRKHQRIYIAAQCVRINESEMKRNCAHISATQSRHNADSIKHHQTSSRRQQLRPAERAYEKCGMK